MRLLVAATGAVSVFLFVATATGHANSLRLRLPGRGRERLSRQVWLHQAGVSVTPLQFWCVSGVAALLVELVCWGVSGSAVVGLVPAAAAGFGPRAYFSRARSSRLGDVVRDWPQGIRDLLNSLQVRRSVHGAIVDLARNGPASLRAAFAEYEALARVGGTPAALATIRDLLADPVSDRVIESLITLHDQGQSLTLQVLQEQAREVALDLATTAEIRAAQHEPRLVATIAFFMPWVGLVLVCASVSAFAAFYQTAAGITVVILAGILSAGGLLVARRLVQEAPEPRVLGGP